MASFGGGLQIALAADIRIVAPDARLAVMEACWGLVPDMAGIEAADLGLAKATALGEIDDHRLTASVISPPDARYSRTSSTRFP